MDPQPAASLEEQLSELRLRVSRLEEALALRRAAETPTVPLAPAAAQTPPAQTPSIPTEMVTPTFAAAPPPPSPHAASHAPPFNASSPNFGFSTVKSAEDGPSFETRVGSQWFNRIGILAILIGMAWFLKLAIDNHWIGPLGRVLIGLVSGAGLIAWSERFRSRGYMAFSYSLKAVGSGILYLSLWAAFSLYQLIPSSAAFVMMIAVTAFNAYLSWAQESELLALYAIAGGLSTPLLVSTGENHEIALFGYLLILDLAVLVLAALRPWSRLLFSAFVGTVVFVLGWWISFYSQSQAGRTGFFLLCFFLIFALAPRLVRRRLEEQAGQLWDSLALVVLPLANAAFGFVAFYGLLDYSTAKWAAPWLAVLFAAFYLFLLRLPATGVLRQSSELLNSLHLSTAVVFLTIAIPLKAQGRWLTIGWLAEAAVLLWVSTRIRSRLLRVLAFVCLALGLVALLGSSFDTAGLTPIFNVRFGTYLFAIAVFAFIAWLARRSAALQEGASSGHDWINIAAGAVLGINLLILIAVSLEIHSFYTNLMWHGVSYRYGQNTEYSRYRMYADFTYSAFFMLYGAMLLSLGFWRRSPFLRWQALVLLAFSIGKVFLSDISSLSQGFRILSFLGLGALLLGVSFVYQRDWLHLRAEKGSSE